MTGDAIRIILEQYGMEPQMIDIDPGVNRIPFLYLEKNRKAANALRDLVQAENGKLWLSETGVIKFRPGTDEIDNFPVMDFDSGNIIEYTPSQTSDIVNHVNIKGNIRRIFDNQSIYEFENNYQVGPDQRPQDDPYYIEASGQLTVWVNFEDPALDIDTAMTLNRTDGSGFKATNIGGTATVYSRVTAEVTPFGDSAKIVFTNNYLSAVSAPAPVRITEIHIFGRPAQIAEELDIDAYDDESIERFEDHTLNVTNNFFASRQSAERYAQEILHNRAKYNPTIGLRVKGNPALEIGDNVQVSLPDGGGNFKVVGVRETLSEEGLATSLTLEKIELIRTFTLNISALDSFNDRLG